MQNWQWHCRLKQELRHGLNQRLPSRRYNQTLVKASQTYIIRGWQWPLAKFRTSHKVNLVGLEKSLGLTQQATQAPLIQTLPKRTRSLSSRFGQSKGQRTRRWNNTNLEPASMTKTFRRYSQTTRTTGAACTLIPNSWVNTTGKMILFTRTSSEQWRSEKWYNRDSAQWSWEAHFVGRGRRAEAYWIQLKGHRLGDNNSE